jgi:hypothetical protein
VSGTVSESSAINNGETGILAIIVSNSEAASNTGDGIDLDARGGVALNVVSSDNGKNGITVANGSVTGSTVTLNKGAGISAVCPSAILNNTIVTNATSIQTTQPRLRLPKQWNASIVSRSTVYICSLSSPCEIFAGTADPNSNCALEQTTLNIPPQATPKQ